MAKDLIHQNGEVQDDELKKAIHFLGTMRGRLIISKALAYAIKDLEDTDADIADMKFLRKTIFNYPVEAFEEFDWEHGTPIGHI